MIFPIITRLRASEHGAALVELALVAPMMAAMVIGMTDLSRAFSMKLRLEQAAQRTIEKIQQQKSVATSSYNSALSTEATSAATEAGFGTGNTITADSWRECGSSTTHEDFTGDCASSSDAVSRYVSVEIANSFTPMFPSRHWPNANSNGDIVVKGYASVRIQ
ncbi:MAG TPA: TadE/TadG family type IV pilus assembly protein [Sphingomicrobium sp.]|jgi:Flp pilus assembly protein TadG|nr:TadE/TadG family type IV pilus assembly protein [Sphingomicrobium sp.]